MNIFNLCTIVTEPADSLNSVQEELSELAQKITNTPVDILIADLLDSAVRFGIKVLAAICIYSIGLWLIKKLKGLLARIFLKKGTDHAVSSFVQSIVSIAMTVMLIIITIGALGVDTTSIAALLAGGGMAIGLALNGTVQNFAGGIMILVFRPFQSGDYIQFENHEGTVTEVNIVSTKLTTVDNRIIIIPNGALSNGTINNFSHNTVRRTDWTIDLEYGCDTETVKEILIKLIESEPRILSKSNGAPADPFVALSALSASSVQFTMRTWVKKEDFWDVKFSMNEKIYTELPKHGLNFPYQKIDITIKN